MACLLCSRSVSSYTDLSQAASAALAIAALPPRADVAAAGLSTLARRVRARFLVLGDLVVGHVPLAAGVGAPDPGGGHNCVQRRAGVKETAADPACLALPEGRPGYAAAAGRVPRFAL